MQVDELREALAEKASATRIDAASARAAISRRVRLHRLRQGGFLVVLVAALTVVVVLVWPGSTPNPTIASSSPLALQGLPGSPSAVSFSTREHGVGLTTTCAVGATTDPVCDIGVLSSSDAGRSWTLIGALRHIVYVGWRGYPFIYLAARGTDVWIYGTRTFESHDGGRTLRPSRLKGLVLAMAPRTRDVWATTRPCPPSQGCATKLMTRRLGEPNWRPLPIPASFTDPYPRLLRPTDRVGYLAGEDTPFPLYRTMDAGQTWHELSAPHSIGPVSLAASGSQHVWVLAAGRESPVPAPAGSPPTTGQQKTLFSSSDGGRHFTLIATSSATRNGPPAPAGTGAGQLGFDGLVIPDSLAAPSPEHLWILSALSSTPLTGSTDGGLTWHPARLDYTGSFAASSRTLPEGTFDFLDPQHGWLAGSAQPNILFKTTDGTTWVVEPSP